MNDDKEYPFYTITLVPFRESDCKTLFDIRNEESIRKGMLNQAPVAWESHQQWVTNNLINPKNVHLFLIHHKGDIAGFSLLKKLPDRQFELGVILKEKFLKTRVAFLAAIATGKYSFEELGGESLLSNVPRANLTALNFNQRMGLEIYHTDEKYFYLKADKNIYQHDLVKPQLKKPNKK